MNNAGNSSTMSTENILFTVIDLQMSHLSASTYVHFILRPFYFRTVKGGPRNKRLFKPLGIYSKKRLYQIKSD